MIECTAFKFDSLVVKRTDFLKCEQSKTRDSNLKRRYADRR